MPDIKIESTSDTPEQIAAATGGMPAKEAAVTPEADPAKADLAETADASGAQKTGTEEKQDKTAEAKADADEEDEDEQDPAQSQDQAGKKKNGFKKRIDKLNKRLSSAEERAIRAEERARLLEEQARAGKPQERTDPRAATPAASDSEPQPDSFENQKDYFKALARWEVKQEQAAQETTRKASEEQSRRKTVVETYNTSVSKAKEAHADFEEAVEELGETFIPGHVVGLIYESENPGELSYHLAKNPDELKRITALSPAAAARELGKFEAKHLSAPATTQSTETKTTKAPPPITPVGARSSVSTKNPDDMTQSEFNAWREEQSRARKRS